MRLGQLCSSEDDKSAIVTAAGFIQYVLEALYFAICNKLIKSTDTTSEWRETTVPVLLMRRQVVLTITDLVQYLRGTTAGEALVNRGSWCHI